MHTCTHTVGGSSGHFAGREKATLPSLLGLIDVSENKRGHPQGLQDVGSSCRKRSGGGVALEVPCGEREEKQVVGLVCLSW